MIADALGRAVTFILAPGQAHELRYALPLLDSLPDVPLWGVGDRIDSSHALRQAVWDRGARPAIPTNPTEPVLACPAWIYANRSRVEQLWGRLKEWRAVATPYDTGRTKVPPSCPQSPALRLARRTSGGGQSAARPPSAGAGQSFGRKV